MSERFDLIVIGGGSAARDAAGKAAREHGARVALIERERWGGSCPNVACAPTKAYLVAAELAHDVDALGPRIGVDAGPARVDLGRVRDWKDSLKRPQPQWVADLEAQGLTPITGEAELVDAHTVRVGERELAADRILIATGSRTAIPPIDGIEEAGWLDHISALELTEVPRSLLVVGAGAVGLEFGQAFSRFGSRVTIVDALDRIAPASDAEASATLAAALREEGIEIATSVFVQRAAKEGDEIAVTVAPRDGSPAYELRVERILLASGRVPNLEGLKAEKLGLETTRTGIVVDEHLRTSVAGIWAAGDVNAVAQLTPVAQYQARIAVADMFGADDAPAADYSFLPTSIFTDPELAGVGLTEEQASEAGHDVGVARNDRVKRFSYIEAKHGLFKIVFDRGTRRVLGLNVVSRNGGDVVQGLALALKLGATVDDLAGMHHVYPTYGEGVKAAAERA
jgi:mercuric reductase